MAKLSLNQLEVNLLKLILDADQNIEMVSEMEEENELPKGSNEVLENLTQKIAEL